MPEKGVIRGMEKERKVGDKVMAEVTYKSVPFPKKKVQQVEITYIEEDDLGYFYAGMNEKWNRVYFRETDIKE